MFVVVRDGWVPERYCDTLQEAQEHRRYCQRCYQGLFSIERCSGDHPRRFQRAIGARR